MKLGITRCPVLPKVRSRVYGRLIESGKSYYPLISLTALGFRVFFCTFAKKAISCA